MVTPTKQQALQAVHDLEHLLGGKNGASIRLRAYIEQAEQAQRVPDGYVTAPVEPSAEMIAACSHNDHGGLVTPDYRVAIYRAMLSAAPKEPT